MRTISLFFALLVAAAPAAAREPCNPPTRNCDDGDGIVYRCPPCPPAARGDHAGEGERLEGYRQALEGYRTTLEVERSTKPGTRLPAYRKGIETYRDGIDRYRDSRAANSDARGE